MTTHIKHLLFTTEKAPRHHNDIGCDVIEGNLGFCRLVQYWRSCLVIGLDHISSSDEGQRKCLMFGTLLMVVINLYSGAAYLYCIHLKSWHTVLSSLITWVSMLILNILALVLLALDWNQCCVLFLTPAIQHSMPMFVRPLKKKKKKSPPLSTQMEQTDYVSKVEFCFSNLSSFYMNFTKCTLVSTSTCTSICMCLFLCLCLCVCACAGKGFSNLSAQSIIDGETSSHIAWDKLPVRSPGKG